MNETDWAILGLAFVAVIYFAGVSRRSYKEKQNKINEIVEKYHEEIIENNHLTESMYPKLLLNADVLKLTKEKEMLNLLKLIKKRHIKNPFIKFSDITHKNALSFLAERQKKYNEEK